MSLSATYTELPSARSSTLSQTGERKLTRAWQVRVDVSAAVNADYDTIEKYVETHTPVTWYEAHPAWSHARACEFGAKPNSSDPNDLSLWLATVTYSTDLKRQQTPRGDGQGTITAGTTGGPSSPATTVDQQTPAALRPPEIDITRVTYEKVVEVDTVTGNKIQNTAGDPFDPPITREASRVAIKLKFWRDATWSNTWLTYFAYNDCVNNDNFSIGGATFPPDSLRCVIESVKPVWELKDTSGVLSLAFHWEISISLEYEPGTYGWRRRTLSTGKREIVSGKFRNIVGADGATVAEPVPLKFDGTKAAPGDSPNYVTNDIYTRVSFAGLLA